MSIRITPLPEQEGARVHRLVLSAPLSILTQSGGVHVQALHIMKEVQQSFQFAPSEFRHLGLTVVCGGSTYPKCAYLWRCPEGLASPVSLPSSLLAQLHAPDLQPLLDMVIDLSSVASLQTALVEARTKGLAWERRHAKVHCFIETCIRVWLRRLAETPPFERLRLEEKVEARMKRLHHTESRLHRLVEKHAEQYIFLTKVLTRRGKTAEERKAERIRVQERNRQFGPPR